jgi:SET domain-containing protein
MKHTVRPDDTKKLDYMPPNKVIIGDSKIQGRGVFSLVDIKKGEIIERCPLIEMEYRSKYQLDPTIFAYLYAQPPCDCEECTKHGFVLNMALGYGMMYNHQDSPNALWKFNYTQSLGDVIAIKDIKANEEIFVSYGNCYFNSKDISTGIEQVKA